MKRFGIVVGILFVAGAAMSKNRDVNYDEAQVGDFELPALFTTQSGDTVASAPEWTRTRRAEILELFRDHVYGRTPVVPGGVRFDVISTATEALDGAAVRSHVRISLEQFPQWPGLDMVLYVPKDARGPVPFVLGLNFFGNHAITAEPDVPLSGRWMRPDERMGIVDHRATEASRGQLTGRWPLRQIVKRGYAVGTAYYGDLEPDHPDGWKDGVRGLLRKPSEARPGHDWGAIGAWAWGLSRMLDYCLTDGRLDGRRSAVIGHSRLGKAALWAGAQDARFALVISNNSGEGGAALARRNFGETVQIITSSFPHWFTPRYASYGGREGEMPVDQHMLMALMAPRPLYIGSASEDRWADPRGEFLSAVHAAPAYALFGKTALGTDQWPRPEISIGNTVGYHLRNGRHDITAFDWNLYLDFADRHSPAADGP